MRVFPIEGRQEKRIILSYTQKLAGMYGNLQYRFPAGHSLQAVRDWSFEARVKGGATFTWNCSSQQVKPQGESSSPGGRSDLILSGSAKNVRTDRDIVLSLSDPSSKQNGARFSEATDEQGNRYLMVRYCPELLTPASRERQRPEESRRDWVFLFEASGDRDPLLARVQIDVMRHLLSHAGEDDTFTVLTANTRVRSWSNTLKQATPENVAAAVAFLEGTPLIGALDLGQALGEAQTLLKQGKNPYLVHLGSGVAAMGERREDVLAKRLWASGGRQPSVQPRHVGVSVGRGLGSQFHESCCGAYGRTIHPDQSG